MARERLADLADSIIPKYPNLLGMSEDEGTAWVVRGDTATIIGRDKAFVYGGKEPTDRGKPFLTLYPGDRYNLATRTVMHRAASESKLSIAFLDSLFKSFAEPSAGGATVLVAQDGKVLVDRSYGIPDQPKYMPTTTVPQFQLGDIAHVFTAVCAQLPVDSGGRGRGGRGGAANQPLPSPLQNCFTRRFATPVGLHKTTMNREGEVLSDVDELYRVSLGYENPRTFARDTTSGDNGASRTVDLSAGWEVGQPRGRGPPLRLRCCRWQAVGVRALARPARDHRRVDQQRRHRCEAHRGCAHRTSPREVVRYLVHGGFTPTDRA